ncbi:MAG: response regulator, partial [Vicinamibacterales bacterium]
MVSLLLVEDNPANAEMLRRRLERRGFEVHVTADGSDALAAITRVAPDLILMDLGLPGMDGLEVTRRLKADPARRRIPVIALTAHALRTDEARALEAGCDA